MLAAAIGAALVLVGSGSAFAGANKLDAVLEHELQQLASNSALRSSSVPIIVQANRPITAEIENEFKGLGGKIQRRFTIIKGFSGTVPIGNLRQLGTLPWTFSVSADLTVH